MDNEFNDTEKENEEFSDTEESEIIEESGSTESTVEIEETDENTETENDSIADNSENNTESDENAKIEIVGIKFKKSGKTYYFDPAGYTLNLDDRVIVDTARGQEYGYTAVSNRMIGQKDIVTPLRPVLRLATPEDTNIHEENLKKEVDAYNSCIALIDSHKLEMKLIDVEMSFDRSKILFYFSAEGRIDFRELVKDLAGIYHTRIEMRQIGIRDEAKILGGLGICGRPFCCSSFLTDFVQVSVKMAKEQNLSLNSAKISGSCGRLMCCLRYEYDTYLHEKELTPKVDSRVVTPDGAGVVTDANPLAGIVKVRLDDRNEDEASVVFVREDVVKEEDYKGEKLTRSNMPERVTKKSSESNIFAVKFSDESGDFDKTEENEKEEPEKENKHREHPKKDEKFKARKPRFDVPVSEKNEDDKYVVKSHKSELDEADALEKHDDESTNELRNHAFSNRVNQGKIHQKNTKKKFDGKSHIHNHNTQKVANNNDFDSGSNENMKHNRRKDGKPYYRNFKKNQKNKSDNGQNND